ncbi:MAG TPA: phosphohydrolase [Planctomycetes bacterium]|nr:phosphohydrolase [Planctomycetota bacterium]
MTEPKLDALAAENAMLKESLAAITDIGIALSAERDLTSLLSTILTKARYLSRADAGSLYLVEGDQREKLRFVLAQNDSLEVPFVEMVLDISSKTIVGHAVSTQQTVNLADAYQIPAEEAFSFSSKFDESVGYRCKSMLAIPMIDHRGRVAGCLQLINRKPSRDMKLEGPQHIEQTVLPFPVSTVRLMESLASQSAVALDKAKLIEDLENTFEGMVRASVVAIEARDPTTSGHSERVATLSVELAKAVSDVGHGKFKEVEFSAAQLKELRYASLLHDFGKVGVREHVLVKAKKLYPWELENVRLRFALAAREREAKSLYELVDNLARLSKGGFDPQPFIRAAGEAIEGQTERLQELLDLVLRDNEPRLLPDGHADQLRQVAEQTYTDVDGEIQPLLRESELSNLQIPRGSLNPQERIEIESHVAHTYRFLSRIPWTEELRDLPKIAGGHHEKLDGSGYPHGLTDGEIAPQSKIMTVADIFDALTAWDRPYKKAVPLEKALAILDAEVNANHIEPQLVELFKERRIFEKVLRGPPTSKLPRGV